MELREYAIQFFSIFGISIYSIVPSTFRNSAHFPDYGVSCILFICAGSHTHVHAYTHRNCITKYKINIALHTCARRLRANIITSRRESYIFQVRSRAVINVVVLIVSVAFVSYHLYLVSRQGIRARKSHQENSLMRFTSWHATAGSGDP